MHSVHGLNLGTSRLCMHVMENTTKTYAFSAWNTILYLAASLITQALVSVCTGVPQKACLFERKPWQCLCHGHCASIAAVRATLSMCLQHAYKIPSQTYPTPRLKSHSRYNHHILRSVTTGGRLGGHPMSLPSCYLADHLTPWLSSLPPPSCALPLPHAS